MRTSEPWELANLLDAERWTNIERLRHMNIEELAKWLETMEDGAIRYKPVGFKGWLKYLQTEVPKNI